MTRRHGRAGQASPLAHWPSTAYLTVLVGIPLLVILAYSFMSRAKFGVGVSGPVSFEAYVKLLFDRQINGDLLFDARYLKVIWTSIWLSGLTTVVCLALSVPIAVWIATRPERWRPLLVFAVTIPFWTNTLVRTYSFLLILNDNGMVNGSLQATGLIDEPLPLLYTDFATTVGLVYTFLPFMILPIYASAERFDFRLAEAAYDLGARRWTVVRRILLPQIKAGVIAGTALVFIPALGSFLQPDLLGGGKTLMIGNVIQAQFGASRNWPFGASLSVLLLVLTMLALLLVALWSRRTGTRARLM